MEGGLPPDWEAKKTPEGRIFYANHNTEETQWDRPNPASVQDERTINITLKFTTGLPDTALQVCPEDDVWTVVDKALLDIGYASSSGAIEQVIFGGEVVLQPLDQPTSFSDLGCQDDCQLTIVILGDIVSALLADVDRIAGELHAEIQTQHPKAPWGSMFGDMFTSTMHPVALVLYEKLFAREGLSRREFISLVNERAQIWSLAAGEVLDFTDRLAVLISGHVMAKDAGGNVIGEVYGMNFRPGPITPRALSGGCKGDYFINSLQWYRDFGDPEGQMSTAFAEAQLPAEYASSMDSVILSWHSDALREVFHQGSTSMDAHRCAECLLNVLQKDVKLKINESKIFTS